jgi:hypothetical protein
MAQSDLLAASRAICALAGHAEPTRQQLVGGVLIAEHVHHVRQLVHALGKS